MHTLYSANRIASGCLYNIHHLCRWSLIGVTWSCQHLHQLERLMKGSAMIVQYKADDNKLRTGVWRKTVFLYLDTGWVNARHWIQHIPQRHVLLHHETTLGLCVVKCRKVNYLLKVQTTAVEIELLRYNSCMWMRSSWETSRYAIEISTPAKQRKTSFHFVFILE